MRLLPGILAEAIDARGGGASRDGLSWPLDDRNNRAWAARHAAGVGSFAPAFVAAQSGDWRLVASGGIWLTARRPKYMRFEPRLVRPSDAVA